MTVDCVLDTSTLIAVIREEPGADRAIDRLESSFCVIVECVR